MICARALTLGYGVLSPAASDPLQQLAERMTQIDQEGLTEVYITNADLADGLTE